MVPWDNILKAFRLVPGTRRNRILLTAWELWLWALVGVPAWLWGGYGLIGGIGGAFVMHEWFFIPYAEKVVGLPEIPESDALPQAYIATLERYRGPMR